MVPDNIPVEVVEHRLPEEERVCPQCGERVCVIGTEVREILKLIPAKAILRRDVYYAFACENCEKALHYLKEQWPYLLRYLEDGRLDLRSARLLLSPNCPSS